MNPQRSTQDQTTKIYKPVRPSYPDPVGRDLAFRSGTGKIKSVSC